MRFTRLSMRLAIAATKDTQWHMLSILMTIICRILEPHSLEVRKSRLPVEKEPVEIGLDDWCNVTAQKALHCMYVRDLTWIPEWLQARQARHRMRSCVHRTARVRFKEQLKTKYLRTSIGRNMQLGFRKVATFLTLTVSPADEHVLVLA